MDLLLKEAIAEINEKYFFRGERDFAYEFYHQVRKKKLPKNVEVTCETSKKRFSVSDPVFENKIILKNFFRQIPNSCRNIYRYPDLLIHEYENRKNQLVAVEIKKSPNRNIILKDLAKLAVYCHGSLDYKKGILIIIEPPNVNLLEVPDIRKLLEEFQRIEIWIIQPNEIKIINQQSY